MRYCTGRKVRGAMVMRDVPLDAAGNPGADQADERRLDDVLAINEVVAVALVHRLEQPPANLRQDADPHIFVFQIDDAIDLVRFDMGQRVVERVGINAALGALRVASEVEHRVRLRVSGQIGRDGQFLFGDADRAGAHNAGLAQQTPATIKSQRNHDRGRTDVFIRLRAAADIRERERRGGLLGFG